MYSVQMVSAAPYSLNAVSLKCLPGYVNNGQNTYSKNTGGSEEPLTAWVQLMGQRPPCDLLLQLVLA